MPDSTTMTIRVSTNLQERLARLAHSTRRSRSFLAAEAIAAYVDRELEIIEGIEQGVRDVEAGRVVSHGDAMDEIDAAIEAVHRKRA